MFILLYVLHTLISKSVSSNCFFNLPLSQKSSLDCPFLRFTLFPSGHCGQRRHEPAKSHDFCGVAPSARLKLCHITLPGCRTAASSACERGRTCSTLCGRKCCCSQSQHRQLQAWAYTMADCICTAQILKWQG